jgi:hypothetical protein
LKDLTNAVKFYERWLQKAKSADDPLSERFSIQSDILVQQARNK